MELLTNRAFQHKNSKLVKNLRSVLGDFLLPFQSYLRQTLVLFRSFSSLHYFEHHRPTKKKLGNFEPTQKYTKRGAGGKTAVSW